MRLLASFICLLLCSVPGIAQFSATAPATPNKQPAKKALSQASREYRQGLRALKRKDFETAQTHFSSAASLNPGRAEYIAAQEFARQELGKRLLTQADGQLAGGDPKKAAEALSQAAQIDRGNPLVQERLHELAAEQDHGRMVGDPIAVEPEIELQPNPGRKEFHIRANTQSAYEQIARAFGLTALFDSSVPATQLRIDIDQIGFSEGVELLQEMSKTFVVPLSASQFLVARDTPDNRRTFERLALQTFRISEGVSTQDLTDIANLLKNVFEVRFVTVDSGSGTIAVRATRPVLDAISATLEGLNQGKPEVRLKVQIFDVDHAFMRQIGTGVPTQFTLFNVQTEAQQLLGSSNLSGLQGLLNGGSLTGAGAAALAALLAGSQGSGAASLINQPFALFGGGITQSGLVIPPASLTANQSDSWLKTLNQVSILASQDTPATFRAGSRYPIETASYSVTSVSSLPTATSGNVPVQTTSVPSFTYEDLGLTVKATPSIHADKEVSLRVELQIRALGGTTVNNVPVISNREYQGDVTCREGETAILAGYLTQNETRAAAGLPWISSLPVLGSLTSNGTKQTDDDQLLVVITPTLIRGSFRTSTEVWLPR